MKIRSAERTRKVPQPGARSTPIVSVKGDENEPGSDRVIPIWEWGRLMVQLGVGVGRRKVRPRTPGLDRDVQYDA